MNAFDLVLMKNCFEMDMKYLYIYENVWLNSLNVVALKSFINRVYVISPVVSIIENI